MLCHHVLSFMWHVQVRFEDPITRYGSAKGAQAQVLVACNSRLPSSSKGSLLRDGRRPLHHAGQAVTHGHSAGYMFNIAMLKKVFNPTFQLHDIRQTAEHELTTR